MNEDCDLYLCTSRYRFAGQHEKSEALSIVFVDRIPPDDEARRQWFGAFALGAPTVKPVTRELMRDPAVSQAVRRFHAWDAVCASALRRRRRP